LGIGQRIKEVRESLNLSQEQFAHSLEVEQGHISGIENQSRNPSKPLLKLICMTYHTNDIWLKTGQGEMFIPPEQTIKEAIEKTSPYISGWALKGILRDALQGHCLVSDDRPDNYLPDAHQSKTADPDLERMISFLIKLWSVGDEKLKAWASIQFRRAFPEDIVDEVEKKAQDLPPR